MPTYPSPTSRSSVVAIASLNLYPYPSSITTSSLIRVIRWLASPLSTSNVVETLKKIGVNNLATVNVLDDQDVRQGIKDFSDWPTIPQLYVKGEFVGGCDIITEMALSAELDTLFDENAVSYDKDAANKIREANG